MVSEPAESLSQWCTGAPKGLPAQTAPKRDWEILEVPFPMALLPNKNRFHSPARMDFNSSSLHRGLGLVGLGFQGYPVGLDCSHRPGGPRELSLNSRMWDLAPPGSFANCRHLKQERRRRNLKAETKNLLGG